MTEEEFYRKEQKQAKKVASKRDRSKYKKTDREKRKRLHEEEAERKLSKKTLKRGRVLSISPEGISIECEGEIILCILSGILKKEHGRWKNLVTVGDFVLFEPAKNAIAHVEERKSVLSRREHLRRHQQQLLAANIDQVLITVSIVEPPLKPALVDRYIIATLKGGMDPVILINKIDLVKEKESLHTFVETYQKLGFIVIPLSAKTGKGLGELKKQMKGRASVFSGQSGAGKSSLINALTHLNLPTGEVARKTQKGVHTTTTTHLIPLDFGGWCIDTPGIRSFGLWDLKRSDLQIYFPEISQEGEKCKYPNCTHSHEPECAVIQAVESGQLSRLRYDSFLKLLGEVV